MPSVSPSRAEQLVTIFAGNGSRQLQIFIISSIKWTTLTETKPKTEPNRTESEDELPKLKPKKTFHHLILLLQLPPRKSLASL